MRHTITVEIDLDEISDKDLIEELHDRELGTGTADRGGFRDDLHTIRDYLLRNQPQHALAALEAILFPVPNRAAQYQNWKREKQEEQSAVHGVEAQTTEEPAPTA